MTNENKLSVKTNGQYKNIELREMDNGDSIVVTKKFGETKRTEKKGNKWNPDKEWTMCQTLVTYNGDDVGMFFPNLQGANGWKDNTTLADEFDAVGGEGDQVKITMAKGLGKNKEGKDVPVYDITFEKVE